MAVTVDAQAQATAGVGVTFGRRAHTGRHGQGNTAGAERLKTEMVGITGLTPEDPDGIPAHGRSHPRRAFQPNPINAVVGRTWHKRADGPAGTTVFLTNALVDKPWQPVADDADRRLSEHGALTESTPQGRLQHPPQKTARAVRVHVMLTVRMFALATAYRRPGEQEDTGGDPVGWQRWRRRLLEQTRDHVIVLTHDGYGIFRRAAFSLLLGVKSKDRPAGIGTQPHILATYGLTAQR